jgi:anti-sigma regulatory factor (Ser/Thr protein kinase)
MKETLNLRLAGGPTAPGRARRALGSLERSLDDAGDDVGLLVSELVTNSVRHGDAQQDIPIELEATASPDKIRVEVADWGPGFEPDDAQREQDLGGYGLQLVDKLAHRWGVTKAPETRVWFEINPRDRHSETDGSGSR